MALFPSGFLEDFEAVLALWCVDSGVSGVCGMGGEGGGVKIDYSKL